MYFLTMDIDVLCGEEEGESRHAQFRNEGKIIPLCSLNVHHLHNPFNLYSQPNTLTMKPTMATFKMLYL